MFNLKTHFEQVSLEIVRTIVEEQAQKEATIEQQQGIKKEPLNKPLAEAGGQPITQPLTLAQAESLN